ncbi:ABC transporter ATP-binding protein [Leucobacter allii]|uniref:ABC transporter ATP-binding protein n=1 Tax=Leucobacter allii TaxID=2932247 RepID=UPI001FD151CE|nr:ABC transporter ATP-binding protein [Leucobacter allii]UOR02182.1 ABC transporter ATP-binding protein [Leucobacter allii]
MTLTTTPLTLSRGRGFTLSTPALEVRPGEVLGLIGPNGSGKSSLLQLLSGFLAPDRGEIRWNGRTIGRTPRAEWATQVAVVPQETEAIPPLTVAEYVRLGRVPFRGLLQSFTAGDLVAADAAIARCGIAQLRDAPLGELSGGQRQRARIARALAQGSRLLLLDEPTNHLDLAAIRDIALLLRELAGDGTAFVTSLHDLNVASQVTTQVAFMSAGSVEAIGPTAETLTSAAVLQHLGVEVEVTPHEGQRPTFSLRYAPRGDRSPAGVPRPAGAGLFAGALHDGIPFAPFGDAPASVDEAGVGLLDDGSR